VFVVRFTLPTAQDLYVKGVGWFVAGVLDVDATDLDAVSRARYLVTSYGAIEIGEVPSWTPPPDLPGTPAGPAPDPYPQYLTLEDIGDAIEAGAIPELRAAFVASVGTPADPVTDANLARPDSDGLVYWVCANGVTPVNAAAGDLIWNADA
jgi:hypothetical protein